MVLTLAFVGVLTPMAPRNAHADVATGYSVGSIFRGGAFCFEVGGQSDGQFQHLKLVTQPASDRTLYNVIAVNGVEHGVCKDYDFENAFVGTATLAPSPDPAIKGKTLLVTLNGGGVSYGADGRPVIWNQHYVLELNPESLAGRLVGYDTGTGAITDGKPLETNVMTYVNKAISPIDCNAFK